MLSARRLATHGGTPPPPSSGVPGKLGTSSSGVGNELATGWKDTPTRRFRVACERGKLLRSISDILGGQFVGYSQTSSTIARSHTPSAPRKISDNVVGPFVPLIRVYHALEVWAQSVRQQGIPDSGGFPT